MTNLSPLIEKRDYSVNGDQLQKNYLDLPAHLKELVKEQFKGRESMNENVEKIAEEVIASEKQAVSPPGWGGTVEKMKKHKDITNPWALAWWMSKKEKGDDWGKDGKLSKKPKPHYKEKKSSVDDIVNNVIGIEIKPITGSSKKYFTDDTLKTDDGYINVKTNFEEKDGQVILEEYIVDKDGEIITYNNVNDFVDRLFEEGLL